MAENNFSLSLVETSADWEQYHAIRNAELFKARNDGRIYNPNNPDEHAPNNFPLLFKSDGESLGTTRLDVRPDDTAIIRLVAITKDKQRKGYGRILQKAVEDFAKGKEVKKLLVNAAPDAVGFYEKIGFTHESWDPDELHGISLGSVQMSKLV